MMAFIGVRISWLILARKADLDAAASSAFSFAARSACSISRRSVMSRMTPSIHFTDPSGSRTALPCSHIQRVEPSA